VTLIQAATQNDKRRCCCQVSFLNIDLTRLTQRDVKYTKFGVNVISGIATDNNEYTAAALIFKRDGGVSTQNVHTTKDFVVQKD
jgi:hypothetical protein